MVRFPSSTRRSAARWASPSRTRTSSTSRTADWSTRPGRTAGTIPSSRNRSTQSTNVDLRSCCEWNVNLNPLLYPFQVPVSVEFRGPVQDHIFGRFSYREEEPRVTLPRIPHQDLASYDHYQQDFSRYNHRDNPFHTLASPRRRPYLKRDTKKHQGNYDLIDILQHRKRWDICRRMIFLSENLVLLESM